MFLLVWQKLPCLWSKATKNKSKITVDRYTIHRTYVHRICCMKFVNFNNIVWHFEKLKKLFVISFIRYYLYCKSALGQCKALLMHNSKNAKDETNCSCTCRGLKIGINHYLSSHSSRYFLLRIYLYVFRATSCVDHNWSICMCIDVLFYLLLCDIKVNERLGNH